MNLGEKIHQLRKARGLSQEELASQLNVSRQAISKWELNESIPDTENVLQFSKLFGVSTDYLLNDEYESDMDIPAVTRNNDMLINTKLSKLRKTALVLTGIGLLGVLTILVLSFVLVSQQLIVRPPLPFEDDSASVFEYTEVRGDFGAFLLTYLPFTGVFFICCAMVLSGAILLVYTQVKGLKSTNDMNANSRKEGRQ